jgi:hypothetical protein
VGAVIVKYDDCRILIALFSFAIYWIIPNGPQKVACRIRRWKFMFPFSNLEKYNR